MDERVARWLSEVRVLDGGMGSECERRSRLSIDGHPAWSCRLLKEDPNLICDIHKSYLRAGADVLSTNTYQAAPTTLARALDVSIAEAVELMRHAVRLARRAITAVSEESPEESDLKYTPSLAPLVAGSLGPYGACLADGSEYTGDYGNCLSFDELINFHYERAKILIESGVDLLAWETLPVAVEVSAICEVMRRIPSALAWLSVASLDGQTTVGGDPLEMIADEVQKCDQIFGVGVNCCIEHNRIGMALSHFADKPYHPGTEEGFHPPMHIMENGQCSTHEPRKKVLMLYANSGELWMPTASKRSQKRGHWVWPPDKGPSDWAKEISKWSSKRGTEDKKNGMHILGRWVGGCCRVEPAQIRQLALYMKPDEFVRSTTVPLLTRVLGKHNLQAVTRKSSSRKKAKGK